MFQSRPTSGSFVLPYFEVASASMLQQHVCGCLCCTYYINSHTHAAAVPYIVSIEALATSK